MKLNENIKILRTKHGFTQEELGKRLSVSKQTVQRYESGEIPNIPYEKIEILSKIFGCSPAFLMGWEVEHNIQKSDNITLSDLEKDIIKKFRTLSDGERAMFLRSIGLEEKRNIEKMA